ncbi:tRNA (adenosine(37)-N6)-threonylcarbamoyltransferase complex dimerization subunit type 1 TsaB [Orrella sp. JC864]|uniref:tRNA (adenosine(37)-N6)-threonylcarbamoyltransferase complex dimerization subunit type 1 TsaB n=1 Tax=Orrella sp. JC864 TaxID=3120298 RepID=UPI0012BCC31E
MEFALLALETSSSRCGVALLCAQQSQPARLAVREHEGTQEHAERLLPMAQALLDEAGLARGQLGAVAFGQGPGGFTGLRVACGVAQGLAYALDVPVLPIGSHESVAAQTAAAAGQCVAVALDARMDEVYLAVLRRGDDPWRWQTLLAPVLIPASQAVPWVRGQLPGWSVDAGLPVLAAGDAWTAYAAAMPLPDGWQADAALRPDAASVARLALAAWQRGERLAPELAAPLYVRDKVAFTTAERERGEGGNPRASLPPAGWPACGGAGRLQPMTAADLDEVAALEQSVQAFPWTRGNFADALQAGYEAWAMRDEHGLAGFYISMPAPDLAHLLVIAVRRDAQGRGLGGALLAHCEAQARGRGLDALLLEVRPSNARARAFYAAQGFVQIGLRRGYYPAAHGQREDALVLRKDLSGPGAGAAP